MRRAQDIAKELRHESRLHRLAMETVFVLEDTLVALKAMATSDGSDPPDRSTS